ncbi:hypothetical protein NMG60_11035081 [Bertholletia excelsa]
MDEFRWPEIVGGKSSGANQMHAASGGPVQPGATRPSPREAPATKPWGFNDPEMKRRKRIAKYKVYTIEGRVKESIRKGLRWIRNKCSEIVHGY